METILSLHNIRTRRGADFTLQVDNLDFCRGTVYALTGPNGAGKSTLLEIAASLLRPEVGQITYRGVRLPKRGRIFQSALREITLVGQHPYLFSGSVADNLAYGLRLRGIRGVEMNERIALVLEDVGLSELDRREGRALSRGQLQRVALARALALRPQVLLLDEPTTGLDRDFYPVFKNIISGQAQQGVTVVIATHESELPRQLNAEMIRLVAGRLACEDDVLSGRLRMIKGGAADAV